MLLLKNKKYLEIFFSILFLVFGFLSGYFSNSTNNFWYLTLEKPFFTPPNYVFKYVWSILYSLLGIFAAKILCENKKYNFLKALFIFHMILNFSWSFLFFYFKNILLALIILFFILISGIYIKIKINKNYSIFLIPYVIWIFFAFLLNLFIYIKN